MKILINIKAVNDDITPERAAKLHRFAPGFATAVHAVKAKARKKGNAIWGWCTVEVSATIKIDEQTFVGHDSLGGCSYESQGDFVLNSGYFDDMAKSAIAEALIKAQKAGAL